MKDKKMKPMQISKCLVLGLALALAAGCHKRPTVLTNLPNYGKTGNMADAGPGQPISPDNKLAGDGLTGTPMADVAKWADADRNREMFKSDTVHFAFDSTVVKEAEKPKVSTVADYLKSHAGNGVEIEGHCDERGTEEYNRSLGERRALALREEMIRLGVEADRVVTLTWGFNHPVAQGHDESSWSQNRRGEFILLTPRGKEASK
jgi:peptidoglycan-associated lipoprotein